jgi:hypothetical protein
MKEKKYSRLHTTVPKEDVDDCAAIEAKLVL